MAICHKCLEHCCFPSRPFLKLLASHVSVDTGGEGAKNLVLGGGYQCGG